MERGNVEIQSRAAVPSLKGPAVRVSTGGSRVRRVIAGAFDPGAEVIHGIPNGAANPHTGDFPAIGHSPERSVRDG